MAALIVRGAAAVVRSLAFYAVFYAGTVLYILLALLARAFGVEPMRRMADAWSGYHRFCARHFLGIRVRVVGELPVSGALVALRHESFFEALDLPTLLGRPAIFAKVELMRIPVWGWLGADYGLVAVERDKGAGALRKMIAAARAFDAEGRLLAIFPEGTRVPHDRAGTIQSGFSGLYKLLGQPVVPIAVNSGPLYHRWWKRAGTMTYLVGETIPPGLPRAEVEARVAAAINALRDDPL